MRGAAELVLTELWLRALRAELVLTRWARLLAWRLTSTFSWCGAGPLVGRVIDSLPRSEQRFWRIVLLRLAEVEYDFAARIRDEWTAVREQVRLAEAEARRELETGQFWIGCETAERRAAQGGLRLPG